MVLPQTQGATQIYLTYISPFLIEHEGEIDRYISQAHDKIYSLSTEYIGRAIFFIKEYASHIIMGTQMRDFPQSQSSKFNQQYNQPSSSSSFSFSNNAQNFFFQQPDRSSASGAGAGAGSVMNKFFGKSSSAGPSHQLLDQPLQTSYLDSFFAKFKNPPSLSTESTYSVSGAGSRGADNNNNNNAFDSNTPVASATLWSSILEPIARTGAAAIQTSLHLPKVSAATYQAQINAANTTSSSPFSYNSGSQQPPQSGPRSFAGSSGPGSLDREFIPSTSSASTTTGASVTGSGATLKVRNFSNSPLSTSSAERNGPPPYPGTSSTNPNEFGLNRSGNSGTNLAVSDNLTRSPSSTSLSASEMGFDFVRYEPEDAQGGTSSSVYAQQQQQNSLNYQSSGVIDGSSDKPDSQMPQQRSSSSWFGWKRRSSSSTSTSGQPDSSSSQSPSSSGISNTTMTS